MFTCRQKVRVTGLSYSPFACEAEPLVAPASAVGREGTVIRVMPFAADGTASGAPPAYLVHFAGREVYELLGENLEAV